MKKIFLWFLCLLLGVWQGCAAKIRMSSKSSTLNFGTNSYFVVNKAIDQFNGTLAASSSQVGNISGQKIYFSSGKLLLDGNELLLTGTLNASSGNQISLYNGNTINLSNGTIAAPIQVESGATATIVGAGILQKPLQLADSSATLQLGLQCNLSQNLSLNGGTLLLLDDLSLNLGTSFVGTGTLNLNQRNLTLPGGVIANANLSLSNVNCINLNGDLTLNTELAFSGASSSSRICGNGFRTTFGGISGFKLNANHQLILDGLHLTNFAALSTRGYFDINATATVILQNCTIALAGNYSHTAGTILFRDNCKIIHNGFSINTSGLAFIVADGVAIEYENLSLTDNVPFTFTNTASQKQLLNSAVIRATYNSQTGSSSSSSGTLLTLSNTNYNLFFDFILTSTNKVLVTNATPGTPKSVTIDWAGERVTFPTQGSGLFALEANVNATLTNTLLVGYNPAVISYGDANASLAFGVGTKINLQQDLSLGNSDKPWNFTGTGEITGVQNNLTLTAASRITVTNSSTLTLRNLRLVLQNASAISCLDSGSRIVLHNCILSINESGFTFAQGNLDFAGIVNMVGGSTAAAETQSLFDFASSGQMRILSQSKLAIDRGIELKYRANPSGDGSNTAATKRHFLLADPSACLELNGTTLHSTTTGLAFNYGRIILDDAVNWIIDGTGAQAMELGSAVELVIRPSANLVVAGQLLHIATTYP